MDRGLLKMAHGCASSGLLFGFCMNDARFGCDSPFGECTPQEAIRNYGSSEHVVGIEVNLEKLSQGYISKKAQEYGRVLQNTLGIKCRFYLTTSPDEECTEIIKPLEFVKSVKKEWTKEQCEEAIRKIAKVTNSIYVDHESYRDEEDEDSDEDNEEDEDEEDEEEEDDSQSAQDSEKEGRKKRKKDIDDETFESFKKSNFLIVDKDETKDFEEDTEEYVRYDHKEFA